jgi:hypothetical protein
MIQHIVVTVADFEALITAIHLLFQTPKKSYDFRSIYSIWKDAYFHSVIFNRLDMG